MFWHFWISCPSLAEATLQKVANNLVSLKILFLGGLTIYWKCCMLPLWTKAQILSVVLMPVIDWHLQCWLSWRRATWSRGLEFHRDMLVGWSLPRFECECCWWCRRLHLFCIRTHALMILQGSGLGLAGASKASMPKSLACRIGVDLCSVRLWAIREMARLRSGF